jgi:hypothetical protein
VYDEEFPRCQDYELWCRMAANFKVANLDQFVLKYRVSSTQGKSTALRASLRYTVKIQRRWLFHREFFNPLNVVYWALEHLLLCLPQSLVLGLFKAITYRRQEAS